MTHATPAAPELHRNKKNGKTYQVYLRVIDCTNADAGEASASD